MKLDHVIILTLFAIGGAWLTYRYVGQQQTTGLAYYEQDRNGGYVSVSLDEKTQREKEIDADATLDSAAKQAAHDSMKFSWGRTLGIWVAAFFTLAMLSFLYRDNPFYKVTEHAFVGISAAYWMTLAFWTVIVPNLLGKIFPRQIKFSLLPGLDLDEIVNKLAAKSWLAGLVDYEGAHGDGLTASGLQLMNVWYWLPMVLGIMLLWRLARAWIARWPLAFILGTTAGIRLTGFLESDFIAQISATVQPLYKPVYDPATGTINTWLTFKASMDNFLIIAGVCCGLVYFFFSLEHRGFVGRISRVGIWVLMITFGAGFGYTVMGRIALLVGRFEFLVSEWLHVVPAQ